MKIICEYCDKEFVPEYYYHKEYNICDDCLDSKEDKTGYCSATCRITGSCDDSC